MVSRFVPLAVLVVVLGATAGVYVVLPADSTGDDPSPFPSNGDDPRASTADLPSSEPAEMTTFESADDFTAYVFRSRARGGHRARAVAGRSGGDGAAARGVTPTAAPQATVAHEAAGDAGDAAGEVDGGTGPARHSGTNVQVEGINEPDILKTNGQHVYYAPRDHRDRRHHDRGDDARGDTKVIDVSPPGTANLAAEIDRAGKLFLSDDRLVVVGEQVWGYNVSDPEDPEPVWSRDLPGRVQTARLQNGKLYLILESRVDLSKPCPVEPMEGVDVACDEIHHPDRPVSVDVTYTVVTLDAESGALGDELSFVGARDATVYMSAGGLYATYTEETPRSELMLDVLLGEARPMLPDRVAARLEEVKSYDLSPRATRVEVQQTLERWLATLEDDRRSEVQHELSERFEEYMHENRRKLTTTHIIRVDTGKGLDLAATGAVPGRPLNQFSLDEHKGHLRIATTVGERGPTESENDVYVLDVADLSVTGAVTGMGETERIYAVRFVGERGYVVTFRRIDPFHVLDLSDPANPVEEGELELPGYSSYLHPLSDDRVLGIGKEDGEVKAVIIDVSDPTDPTIEKSRVLAADWSAIARTHHAFLLDRRYGVFFLPTESGGKVLSAETLRTVHTVALDRPRRAIYVDDYLYVFGDEEVVVIDETRWKRVETLSLD